MKVWKAKVVAVKVTLRVPEVKGVLEVDVPKVKIPNVAERNGTQWPGHQGTVDRVKEQEI